MKPKLDVLPPNELSGITFNSSYPLSIPSIIKVVELVFLVTSLVLSIQFKDGSSSLIRSNWNIQKFHLLIAALGVVGNIIVYAAYCLNIINIIQRRFNATFLLLTLVHVAGVIFLLISTSIILQDCVNFRNYKVRYLNELLNACHQIDELTSTSCSVYEGSAATGCLALIGVILDTFLHGLKYVEVKKRLAAAREEVQKKKDSQAVEL